MILIIYQYGNIYKIYMYVIEDIVYCFQDIEEKIELV